MESLSQGKKIAIIGATGAVGREIVRHARLRDDVAELALIVRRSLPEWI